MKYKKEQYELAKLILAAIDGSITSEQFRILDKQLGENPEVLDFYAQFVNLQYQLRQSQNIFTEMTSESVLDTRLWEMLLEDQRNAEAVQVEIPEKAIPVSMQKVERGKIVRKINKGSLVTAIMSAAALLFFVLFSRFAPIRKGMQVATLLDTVNARWEDYGVGVTKGQRFQTSYTPLMLQTGFAKIQFDNNASVVIEAPAEFQILAVDQINLSYGCLYAVVPTEAIGFTINTGNAKVVDLGTEFGVRSDADGIIELHVIKGQTNLFAGKKSNRHSQIVTEGNAKRIEAGNGIITNIACNKTQFTREINSKTHFLWKGQSIDLSDLVGGGNGLGVGRIGVWLDLKTGREGTDLVLDPKQQADLEDIASLERRTTDDRYHLVTHLPYVDGVFSPDGGVGPVQISSQRHLWNDCPDTTGIYFEDIFNGSYIGTSYNHELILDGQAYGTKEYPALALHSNAGITFDLDAIRADMPGLKITHFKSLCGISQEAGTRTWRMDFYVLVDGKKRFESLDMNVDSGPREIAVPLSREDRFLTLVATDGDLNPSYDWGLFAMPRLEIENTQ